jgi:hypothetical protein
MLRINANIVDGKICTRWLMAYPVKKHYLQCFIVTNSFQLVQDFFHPQYHAKSKVPANKCCNWRAICKVSAPKLLQIACEKENSSSEMQQTACKRGGSNSKKSYTNGMQNGRFQLQNGIQTPK